MYTLEIEKLKTYIARQALRDCGWERMSLPAYGEYLLTFSSHYHPWPEEFIVDAYRVYLTAYHESLELHLAQAHVKARYQQVQTAHRHIE